MKHWNSHPGVKSGSFHFVLCEPGKWLHLSVLQLSPL